jgi:hypothetical protein
LKNARLSMVLVTALFCAHAAPTQEAGDPKEAPARDAGSLPHFESAVLSGNQTKQSAYRRVSTAKDPEALASTKDGKPVRRPSELPRRRAADKAKGG